MDLGKDTSRSSATTTSGYMNSMQFSHIWRKLTGESGNLYREIQVCICVYVSHYSHCNLYAYYMSANIIDIVNMRSCVYHIAYFS